jgi:hypothetical protein
VELVLRLPVFAPVIGDLSLTPTGNEHRGDTMAGKRNKADDTRTEDDGTEPQSVARRKLLRMGGIAAAGAAGAVLMTATPASAGVDGDLVLGFPNNEGTGTTVLKWQRKRPGIGREQLGCWVCD